MDMIKELIIKIINDKQGCKLTELSVTLAETLFNNKNHENNFEKTHEKLQLLEYLDKTSDQQLDIITSSIDELIKEKELVAIQYNLPNMEYRDKVFLLPKDTKLFDTIIIPKEDNKTDSKNISFGSSLLYITMITSWVFGIALSIHSVISVIACILFPLYAWVVSAYWVIELVNMNICG
jgi:hypothetical protein